MLIDDSEVVYKGTGRYEFNQSDIGSRKKTKLKFWFEVRTSGRTIGEWDIIEVSPGVFHLVIAFDDASESPFYPPTDPVTFQIISPFTPELMSLELIPPPDTNNTMTLTKYNKPKPPR